MARAIYEKRKFHNQQTGEDVEYEVYGIVSIVNGERMELALKGLSPAEKIAFKMVMTGSDPQDLHTTTTHASEEEKETFNKGITRKPSDTNDNEWLDELAN